VILLKGIPKPAHAASQPIAQSTAMVILFMVVGIAIFLWYTRYLRSRAALIALAMVIGLLVYLAFFSNPITAP
jgi:peptidoglycan/LPS O-acetylase OafA/YrhL